MFFGWLFIFIIFWHWLDYLKCSEQVLYNNCQFMMRVNFLKCFINILAYVLLLSILNVIFIGLHKFYLKDPYILCWDMRKAVDVVYK